VSQPTPSSEISYQHLIRAVLDAVSTVVPAGCTVLVVSKGDDELLRLEGRQAWYFPRAENGAYAGYYPANSTAAIAHLEASRVRGADCILFPATSFWWLERYSGFAQHLRRHYRALHQDEMSILFNLHERPESWRASALTDFEEVLAEFEDQFEHSAAVLDWNTGLELAACYPQHTVFSPPSPDPILPYLDGSIDLVALPATHSTAAPEARRVARAAVLQFDECVAKDQNTLPLRVDWKTHDCRAAGRAASIIVHCPDGALSPDACWGRLRETLPRRSAWEVLLVDDRTTGDMLPPDSQLRVLRNPQPVGWATSCNRAATEAEGEILIFLASGALPLLGWYRPLVRLLRTSSDTGAVGGKVLYPDGRLLGAGGVLFADGSMADLGQGDYDGELPLYSYVRPIDCPSPGLFATTRRFFRTCGGFAGLFESYAIEVVDYCLHVRAHGARVRYQPECVVVWCGASPPRADGVETDRARLVEKWHTCLQLQPPRPDDWDATTWRTLATASEPDESNFYAATAERHYPDA
jgi:GT2 family glycosyltransferase